MAGFTEVVTWILGSHDENFTMVNRKDDGNTAVIIGNPRTSEFEVSGCLVVGVLCSRYFTYELNASIVFTFFINLLCITFHLVFPTESDSEGQC